MYPAIPDAYAEALGSEGMEAYHACLQQAWDALPELPAQADWSEKYHYIRLRNPNPLLKRAEAHGDLPAILTLYQKTANDERDCLDAAELCIAHDAWDQVELWLARAAKAESKHPHHRHLERERLQERLLLHRGEPEAAAKLQWEIYQHTQ